ncbi:VWFA and cache domain-containing protein 1-like isoform X1 [Montipora foliosa]|uniref:VWFA and cache domain-containing protein 1-like isoform X1 n=1 Tax=Montipora foliosa TaxID=591990 RepID=UPI0035F11BDB
MDASSRRRPFLISFIVLGPYTVSFSLLLAQWTGTQANLASQLADSFQEAFVKNTGFDYLHTVYDSLPCVYQDNYGKQLLENITKPARDRLNTVITFLQNLNENLQHISSKYQLSNVSCCCQGNEPSSLTVFHDRLQSFVNLWKGCTISESYQGSQDDLRFNSELLNGFRENFNKSVLVSWQYYGSINGEYLQYPSNKRHCEGNASNLDPRFKSWYVETASPVKKNVVIIIDRSASMRRLRRMELAKDAAITVLDTLSPQDNVGIVVFSTLVNTPSGCFGSTVAAGIPANLEILKDWVREIRAFGATNYIPAFRQAFKMLHNVTTRQRTSERSNIILFLTDGAPTDSEAGIYREIRRGQSLMTFSVQVNTYALGGILKSKSLRRLQKIANKNGGVFQQIKDQTGGALKRLMGSYYTSINSSLERKPRLSLPFMDSRLGLMVSMSLAVIRNGSFTGVVAVDLPIQRLFKEALQLSSASLAYAILVDNEGRAVLHPSIPGPSDVTSSRSFLPLSLFEPSLPSDVIIDITSGRSGKRIFEASFPQPLGNNPTDGTRMLKTNATYMWTPVGESDYYIVCVLANDQSLRTDLKSFTSSSQLAESFYHRLDLSWNAKVSKPRDICRWKNALISPTSSTVKIASDAFWDPNTYIFSSESLIDLQDIQQFFNAETFQRQRKYKAGLSEAIRAEVKLTSILEDIWQRADLLNPDLVQWRFVGTQKGVLRTYPGFRFQKTYSHTLQPWYMKAVSSRNKLMISVTTSTYQPNTTVVTLSKAVRKNRCDKRIMEVLAVIGMEMTESAFLKMIADKVGLNNDSHMDWYLVDSSGYIEFNMSSRDSQVRKEHLTSAFPWLANELIHKKGVLKVSWCNNYLQHTVQMFYEVLDFTNESSNSGSPCRQFRMNVVPGTSLFLLGIPSRSIHQCSESSLVPQEGCSCGNSCTACSDNVSLSCQCPCACLMPYDTCHNSVTRLLTSIPCPVPPPPLYDTEKDQAVFQTALVSVRRCARDCLKISNRIECEKSIDCHWCTFPANPSCNSECRTNKSLSMAVLFPCNDLVNLSAVQQVSVKFLFTKTLRQFVPTLTSQSLQILKLRKRAIAFKVQATTTSSDLDTAKRNIRLAVNQGEIAFGPAMDLPDIFVAKNPKQFTDLVITLTMDSIFPLISREMHSRVKSELQSILVRLLRKSLVTLIRHFSVNKTSIRFVLSNEGQADLYPLQPFKEKLEKAVKLRLISFQVPFGTERDAVNKTTALNMSATSTFDSLCRPYYAKPSQESTTILTSQVSSTLSSFTTQGLTENPHSTQHQDSTVTLTTCETGRSSASKSTEKDKEIKQGLTPIETGIIVGVSVVSVSSFFCILFLIIARRRRETRKRVSPERDEGDDRNSEKSEISEIDSNVNVVFNRAYLFHEEVRTCHSTWKVCERANKFPMPKHAPEGAWF